MLHAVVTLLAEAGPSKTPFIIVGLALAAWAVILTAMGMSRPDFPGDDGATRVVMGISAVLVVGAMTAAIVTS